MSLFIKNQIGTAFGAYNARPYRYNYHRTWYGDHLSEAFVEAAIVHTRKYKDNLFLYIIQSYINT
jgi:hypothetical protein